MELSAPETVRAAGGVVRRAGQDGDQVLLVHRPRYDDWTFPKGKAHAGEADHETALREVEEETGLLCELGLELPSTRYEDSRGRPKVVRYWTMRVRSGAFEPHGEVDAIEWLPRAKAARSLSYERDHDVLQAVRSPLLVVRHATAGSSEEWAGDDARRPLDERGRMQASRLVDQLAPFAIDRIISSPFDRCVETVEPLAAARGLPVALTDDLAEGVGAGRVRALLADVAAAATVICGHGPELVPLFGRTKKGETVIVEATDEALGELGRLPPPG